MWADTQTWRTGMECTVPLLEKVDIPSEWRVSGFDFKWKICPMLDMPLRLAHEVNVPAGVKNCLQKEGMTLEELRSALAIPTAESQKMGMDSVIQTLGQTIISQTKPQFPGARYKKLALFSGITPLPAGEEGFNVCITQVT